MSPMAENAVDVSSLRGLQSAPFCQALDLDATSPSYAGDEGFDFPSRKASTQK